MKDEDGFRFWTNGLTNERTDICDCRVAFATENWVKICEMPLI